MARNVSAFSAALILVLVAISGIALPAEAQSTTSPAQLALGWGDAINRGDAAAAAALFAPDGIFVGVQPCLVPTPCVGPANVVKRSAAAVAVHDVVTAGTPTVAGDLVQVRSEVRNDGTRAAGVDRIVLTFWTTVQGDKITSLVAQWDLQDEQTARYQAARAPAGSVAVTPATLAAGWLEAINAGDSGRAPTFFATDAAYIAQAPCIVRATPCRGLSQIANQVTTAAAAHRTFKVIDSRSAGALGQVRFEDRDDSTRAAGVDRFIGVSTATIGGDRIASWLGRPDITDPQTATWYAANLARTQAAAPAQLPRTGGLSLPLVPLLAVGAALGLAGLRLRRSSRP